MCSETALADRETEVRRVGESVGRDRVAISARNLGKRYNIYANPRDKLKEVLMSGKRQYHREFWALRNVSFDVGKGESVGIVGRNGSGKSTLLRIVCGTLSPTEGTVETHGRVAGLLELGSGFNPEYTGRENVHMAGAILGLSKKEMIRKYQEIVDFAEVADFMDQPVRTYSSGMFMRLAFSVAANLDPDILVIDEALAVGDEIFRRKCFSRIHSLRERGVTILFVSHAAPAVVELCDRAVLLDRGQVLIQGSPKAVIANYQRLIYAPASDQERLREEIRTRFPVSRPDGPLFRPTALAHTRGLSDDPPGSAYFDPALVPKSTVNYEPRGARIVNPRILTPDGRIVNNLLRRETYVYTYFVEFSDRAFDVRAGMLIKTLRGIELGGCVSAVPTDAIPVVEAGTRLRARFEFRCLLAPGTYFLNAGVEGSLDGTTTYLTRALDVAVFKVQPEKHRIETGIVDFLIEPQVDFQVENSGDYENAEGA